MDWALNTYLEHRNFRSLVVLYTPPQQPQQRDRLLRRSGPDYSRVEGF